MRALYFLAILFFIAGLTHSAEVVDQIVAAVNDDIITLSDLRNMVGDTENAILKAYSPKDPQLTIKLKEVRESALNQLIERRLIIQQFNSRGGRIPDNIVEEDIQMIIDEQYGRDRTVFIKTLEAHGLNLETYKERIKEKIIVRYMQQNEVNNEVIISPFKIEKYYKDHPDEFVDAEKVKLRMLYIKRGETSEEIQGARALAQELLIKLSTGSDFASIASVYSEGNEKKDGGNLGFVEKETLREELRDAAFSLNPGQVSKVIETKDGFYILQIDEKKPSKTTTMEEARSMIERLLTQEERQKRQERWIKSLRQKAFVKLF